MCVNTAPVKLSLTSCQPVSSLHQGPLFVAGGAWGFGAAQFDGGCGRVGGEGGDGQRGLGGLLREVAGDWFGCGGGDGAREEKGDGDGGEEGKQADARRRHGEASL